MYLHQHILRKSYAPGLLAWLLATVFVQAAEATDWMGSDGAVLLQNNGRLALQGFNLESQEKWTTVPEHAGEWQAVAMDGSHVLFFYEPTCEMAVCTIDETGAPSEWLALADAEPGFVPVALEGHSILLQNGPYGALLKIQYDADGLIMNRQVLWKDSLGWKARGMNANRIVLEHTLTGDVAICAVNPAAPLFRPYKSFKLQPDWEVRDLAGDFVLIQQKDAGPVEIVELGDGYEACRHIALGKNSRDWNAVALANKL